MDDDFASVKVNLTVRVRRNVSVPAADAAGAAEDPAGPGPGARVDDDPVPLVGWILGGALVGLVGPPRSGTI